MVRSSLLFGCIVALCASAAVATRVVVTVGSVEVDSDDWSVRLFVVAPNPTTGALERIPDFYFIYEPKFVGEYFDFAKQVGAIENTGQGATITGSGIPINFTLPTDPSLLHTSTYSYSLPNGSEATVIERTARLPNGANFTQTVETFSQPSWKNVYGWKMPVNPGTMKITARFTNWPYTDSIRPVNTTTEDFIKSRGVVLIVDTSIRMLLRPDSGGFLLKDHSVWPVYSYEDAEILSEPFDPAVIPDRSIHEDLALFRDRRFSLGLYFLMNSSYCNTTDDCAWKKVKDTKLVPHDISTIQQVVNASMNPDVPLDIKIPLYIGFAIMNATEVEWDPNVELLFGGDPMSPSQLTPLDAALQTPGMWNAIVGGAVGGAILVSIIVGIVFWRSRVNMKKQSKDRVSRAVGAMRNGNGDDNNQAESHLTTESPADSPAPESKRWTHVSRGRVLTNVDEE